MLVLTRCIGESILVGDDITVTLVSIAGKQARIGITAPRQVAVHREETYEQFKSQHGQEEPKPRGRYGESL